MYLVGELNSKSCLRCIGYYRGYLSSVCPVLHFPPLQGGVRQLDDEVWALFSNFSNGQAGSSRFFPSSSKYSSSSSSSSSSSRIPTSSSSSSSRWSLRNLSPPSSPYGMSSSVRPTRPQPPSPGRSRHLQVHCQRLQDVSQSFCILVIFLTSGICLWVAGPAVDRTEQELSEQNFCSCFWGQQQGRPWHVMDFMSRLCNAVSDSKAFSK